MKFVPFVLLLALALVGCNTEEAADAVAEKANEVKAGVEETAAAGLEDVKTKLTEQVSGLEGQLGEIKGLASKANNEQVNNLIAEAEGKILSIKERATEIVSAEDPMAVAKELGAEVKEVDGIFAKIKELLKKLIPGM